MYVAQNHFEPELAKNQILHFGWFGVYRLFTNSSNKEKL